MKLNVEKIVANHILSDNSIYRERKKHFQIIQLTNATILDGMFEKPLISNENANSSLTLRGPCLRPPSSCVSL